MGAVCSKLSWDLQNDWYRLKCDGPDAKDTQLTQNVGRISQKDVQNHEYTVNQGFTGFKNKTPLSRFLKLFRERVWTLKNGCCCWRKCEMFRVHGLCFELASCFSSLVILLGDPCCSFKFRKFSTRISGSLPEVWEFFWEIQILFERFRFFLRDSDLLQGSRILFEFVRW